MLKRLDFHWGKKERIKGRVRKEETGEAGPKFHACLMCRILFSFKKKGLMVNGDFFREVGLGLNKQNA
jgi:hypothetical protein